MDTPDPKAARSADAEAQRPLTATLADLATTAALGRALGEAAQLGDCVALVGGLGAGKTTLSRAISEAFGILDPLEFASPTYTYLNLYAGRAGEVMHFDFYRLGGAEDACALGLDEQLARTDALALVEWAELVPELVPPGALWLTLARTEGTARSLEARGGPAHLRQALHRAVSR